MYYEAEAKKTVILSQGQRTEQKSFKKIHVGKKLVCDIFLVSEKRMIIQWNAGIIMHLEKDSDITSGRRSVLRTRKKCFYCPKDRENLSIIWNPQNKQIHRWDYRKVSILQKYQPNQAKTNKPEMSATQKRFNILAI